MTTGDQLDLLTGGKAPARRPVPPAPTTAELPTTVDLPIARVVVETAVPHLARPFDYLVPPTLADRARPGVRCLVQLAGRRVTGFVLERAAGTDFTGTLHPLLEVPSPVPVLTGEVLAVCRRLATTHAGTLPDVLRLAVPPRHARTEKAYLGEQDPPRDWWTGDPPAPPPGDPPPAPGDWDLVTGGAAFLHRLAAGEAPRAVVVPPAGPSLHPAGAGPGPGRFRPVWAGLVATAAAATLAGGRAVLVVVPDARDLAVLTETVTAAHPGLPDPVRLSADLGPAARYRAFLEVLSGRARVVVGTRAAAFAPVARLGLVVCVDDGNDSHAEPHAPYPHTRDVLSVRAEQAGSGMLVIGPGCTVESAASVAAGWARLLRPPRPVLRDRAPRVVPAADDEYRDPAARLARVPSLALRTIREAVAHGPVLVQVPRAGYIPRLCCQRCRTPASCGHCHGPLRLPEPGAAPSCQWCGRVHRTWVCPGCAGTRVRWARIGSERTGEELGRAVPGVLVRHSGAAAAAGVLDRVGPEPALVIATVGAEPPADDGYAAAVLLDAHLPLLVPRLDAQIEAARRFLTAATLVRPARDGGRVVIVADPAAPAVQALIRWDPDGLAQRELTERIPLGLPPAGVIAEATGDPQSLHALQEALRPPPGTTIVPETTGPDEHRLLLRVGLDRAEDLAVALAQARSVVSAGRARTLPRIRMRADA